MQMSDWHDVPWTEFFAEQSPDKKIPSTGIDVETIKTICNAVSTVPQGIEVHNQVSGFELKITHKLDVPVACSKIYIEST